MNFFLDKPFEPEKLRTALFQMSPSKAPGIDGFTAGFFHRHWNLVQGALVSAILGFLNGGDLPVGFNDTSITLIPKVKNPQNITQYRPISLCPVPYKIGAKMITNRMKEIMDAVVGEEQSAFVPGRLITDNVVVAFESVNTMRRRKKGKNYTCAIKLDMMKAYDMLEWPYLRAVMLKLGISPVFTDAVMRCVLSVSFSVLFNGGSLEGFRPTRGLRQGDPISPYLFLLAAEGLSCLLKSNIGVQGMAVAPEAPLVNHLLFADDSLLFFEANETAAVRVDALLRTYCNASGQRNNMDKSSIFFS